MQNEISFVVALVLSGVLIAVFAEFALPVICSWFEVREHKWKPKLAKNCPYCNSPRSIIVWHKGYDARLVSYNCSNCEEANGIVLQVKE